jgi:hypothetical protein
MSWTLPRSFLFLFLVACTTPTQSLTNLKELPKDRTILVGKITINRKFPESTNVVDVMDVTKSALIRSSLAPLPFHEWRPEKFDKGDLLVKWGDVFAVPVEKGDATYVQGVYAFTYDKKGQTTYAFPVMGFVKIPANSTFVYIGTLDLKVDDFFQLEAVTIRDEFGKLDKEKYPKIKKSLFQISN